MTTMCLLAGIVGLLSILDRYNEEPDGKISGKSRYGMSISVAKAPRHREASVSSGASRTSR